ncbi:acyclic terpene utilization AtuA family protein [Amycolatopsis thermalba]|uniref:acyclic terpene utilization AtuA family protein n=1 Tax=Amycolatopsis thermalba TaxID=944492 RepID=UPI000E220B45|nr:acyclic terpene utilization AtuA family protein [Amycolatopsis thermalba]
MTAVRIANFSGYLGDRYTAIDEAMSGDPVDVLIGDYLAEVTLAALATGYRRDPERGYVEYFVGQIRPHLAAIAQRGVKVVTNAGGFHPAALAEKLRKVAADEGVPLRIAHVEGDNVLSRLGEYAEAGHRLENLDTGAPLASWGHEPLAANAYLGGWGIAAALAEGADIVVCGRVADASLVTGPAAWWHGWATDDWNALAGAVTAGHVIECGPQAVGGNFAGFTRIPDMLVPGFPIAEVAADGSSVITKHTGHGGAVTVDTVTAQLVYEIQGPRYLNPDVTVHLDTVRLAAAGPDRVEVTGATGSPPPPTTKVAVFAAIGHTLVNTVYVTAPDVDAKVALLRAQITREVPEGVELDITRLGTAATDPETQWDATVAVRVMAVAATPEPLAKLNLAGRLGSLYLQSIPGFYHDGGAGLTSRSKPRIDYWPALLPMSEVPHRVVLDDGRTLPIAPPPTAPVQPQPVHPEPAGQPLPEPARKAPLGTVAYARSGDKGGNSNVGVWVPDERAWSWLRQALSTAELRKLLPETGDLGIVRHEFPHLRAVHFVLRGLLGTGGSANLRADQVGKAVGEYLRAKHVLIPEELLDHVAD